MTEKKSTRAARLIDKNIDRFACPVCGQAMQVDTFKSLVCRNSHRYDISKNGYVNMLQIHHVSKYTRQMFEARNKITHQGFFDPLINELTVILNKEIEKGKNDVFILDAGCGEGSLSSRILNMVSHRNDSPVIGTGIDIAKDGIHVAAREHEDCIWIVGDITNLPIASQQCDVVVNILSPSNYTEFKRVLKNNKIVIKVIPGLQYLSELRNIFLKNSGKEHYSNEDVIRHFEKHFRITERKEVLYTIETSSLDIQSLVKMTPLLWDMEDIENSSEKVGQIKKITVDLTILVGKKA